MEDTGWKHGMTETGWKHGMTETRPSLSKEQNGNRFKYAADNRHYKQEATVMIVHVDAKNLYWERLREHLHVPPGVERPYTKVQHKTRRGHTMFFASRGLAHVRSRGQVHF
jgi:hypothetical protein